MSRAHSQSQATSAGPGIPASMWVVLVTHARIMPITYAYIFASPCSGLARLFKALLFPSIVPAALPRCEVVVSKRLIEQLMWLRGIKSIFVPYRCHVEMVYCLLIAVRFIDHNS